MKNKYKAFYKNKETIIESDSLYHAKLKAIEELKVPKKDYGVLAVMLVELDGEQVIHFPID